MCILFGTCASPLTILGTYVLQECIVTSPRSNTITTLCNFLGIPRQINVTASCLNCETPQLPVTMTGASPIEIPNLTAANYTVKVFAVDYTGRQLENNAIVKMMTVYAGIL